MNTDVIKKLQQVIIFASLKDDEPALANLAGMMEVRSFKKGENIIKEGDEGNELFILFKGTVEICKSTLFNELYTVTKLSAENNAFFGELALVDNEKRSATVVARTDCELLVLKKTSFLKLGDHNPATGLSVTRSICHILGQRLRRANQDNVTLYEALVGEIEEST